MVASPARRVLAASDPIAAGRELADALPVFEQLGSAEEARRALVLLARTD